MASVSYTHLDVYKRQYSSRAFGPRIITSPSMGVMRPWKGLPSGVSTEAKAAEREATVTSGGQAS